MLYIQFYILRYILCINNGYINIQFNFSDSLHSVCENVTRIGFENSKVGTKNLKFLFPFLFLLLVHGWSARSII